MVEFFLTFSTIFDRILEKKSNPFTISTPLLPSFFPVSADIQLILTDGLRVARPIFCRGIQYSACNRPNTTFQTSLFFRILRHLKWLSASHLSPSEETKAILFILMVFFYVCT